MIRTQRIQEELLARLNQQSNYNDDVKSSSNVNDSVNQIDNRTKTDSGSSGESDEESVSMEKAMEFLREHFPDAECVSPPLNNNSNNSNSNNNNNGDRLQDTADYFDSDIDLLQLQVVVKLFAPQFQESFSQGMKEYLKGT